MTAVQTSHRATQEQGPSVVDGQLMWTSATGITTADPQSYGGCSRKWYYDQVEGKKGPATRAMLAGTELHTEIESYLRGRGSLQSPLALAGRAFIPQPGNSLLIEQPIHFTTRDGVQIYGHVDLYNLRGEYVDPNGELQRDPSWSMEVKDWKTTSDFQYAKTERDLAENIQLTTYAEAGFRMWVDLEHARLTHVYFRTRGRPESKLVTIRRSREEIGMRWDYAESVVRIMGDVAKEQNAERVPANVRSCSAYSGCPHRGYCSAFRRTSLDALYGKAAQDYIQENNVGLLASNPQLMQPAAAPTAPAPSVQAQLAQEEAQMRAQFAQQQQQMPQQLNTAQLADVCQRLSSYGFGFPAIGGNAAQAYAVLGGQSVPPGYVFQGIPAPPGARRSLHLVQLNELAHIFQIEGELAQERAAMQPQQPTPAALEQKIQQNLAQTGQTPYVPVTTLPPQNFTQQLAQQTGAPVQGQAVVSFLPPGAPESMPQLAAAQPKPPEGAEPAEKKGRGRPKKVQDAAPEATAAVAVQVPPQPPSAPATQAPPAAVSTLDPDLAAFAARDAGLAGQGVILVNARFEGRTTRSLAGYVDYINEKIAKMYNTRKDGSQGPLDVRAAVDGSGLGYGGWKGYVREIVKADPPPDGAYHFDTFMSELNEVVADALRVVAVQKDWMYVRGVRA